MAVSALGGGIYEVDSDSGNTYSVDLLESRCSCPDHQMRGERCKHIRRVALEITGGRLPAPGQRAVECLHCGRGAFVPESAPAVCERCYLPPGTTVRDRETGAVVVVVETTGDRADEVTIAANRPLEEFGAGAEGEAVTVADYPKNEHYPSSDPVVRAVYPFSGDPETPFDELRQYSFPLSRLEQLVPRRDGDREGSPGRVRGTDPPALPAE
ncbi:SWIM zinc finger family protein [Halomarina litorea]|uniref:SWIM zinc finger family protein n=1 Tax=Halomarina litorea TaxID=2961595 RepID=UPI0034A1378F